MLTAAERAVLEALLTRVRTMEPAAADAIQVGDLVQLRPGADPHWETSLLLVTKLRDDGRVKGQILRPHRSGCIEADYTYTPPEVIRIGEIHFPPPCRAIRDQSYLAWCPKCSGRE